MEGGGAEEERYLAVSKMLVRGLLMPWSVGHTERCMVVLNGMIVARCLKQTQGRSGTCYVIAQRQGGVLVKCGAKKDCLKKC